MGRPLGGRWYEPTMQPGSSIWSKVGPPGRMKSPGSNSGEPWCGLLPLLSPMSNPQIPHQPSCPWALSVTQPSRRTTRPVPLTTKGCVTTVTLIQQTYTCVAFASTLNRRSVATQSSIGGTRAPQKMRWGVLNQVTPSPLTRYKIQQDTRS